MLDKSRFVCGEYIGLREVNDLDAEQPTSSFGEGYQVYCDQTNPSHIIHSAGLVLRAVADRRPNASTPTIVRITW